MNHSKSEDLPESIEVLPEKLRMYFFRVYNIKEECIVDFKSINDEDKRSLSMFFDTFIMRKLRINGVQVACYTTGTDSVESELNKHAWLLSILCEKVETLLGAESILGAKNIDEYLSEVQADTRILELALKSTEVSNDEQMLRIISDKLELYEEKLAELVFGQNDVLIHCEFKHLAKNGQAFICFPAPAERYVYSTRYDADLCSSGVVCEFTSGLVSTFSNVRQVAT